LHLAARQANYEAVEALVKTGAVASDSERMPTGIYSVLVVLGRQVYVQLRPALDGGRALNVTEPHLIYEGMSCASVNQCE
jgi:hypothetical protein